MRRTIPRRASISESSTYWWASHFATGIFCEVRCGEQSPGEHQSRNRQRIGGLRPAVSRRIRRYPDSADCRPSLIQGANRVAQFSVNPTRLDPYKNFKFRLKWDGKYVFGCSKVSPLKRMTRSE